ncbi:hypothetical protein B5M09_005828 [Aphanomyces astaci]|uniref:Uncharacterized protein n=1 Tax=Aphanomyces astaci TaxID=112090 RepID=A0A3R7XYL3_APHAT|nr:hypothetical protein B5M09_005828 [Aphanomyces astaci]
MASSYDQVSRVSESKSLMEDNSTPSATASPVAKPVTAEKPAEASTPVATPVPVAVPVAAAVPSSERSALLPASSSDTAITKFKQMEIERINGYLRSERGAPPKHPGYKNAMSVRHIRIEEGEEDDEVPHYGTTPEKAV